ncbi:GNAT family N-acetyltransferase [Nocardia bhagyanarayanae]|uniref:Acetyltransferase (GNAT) family protein n=1 Tax=Nocardia bhagyanarayanae TaxID=1215925 RepID=A0A543FDN9_9NOCA|nr:GNAT family N-acetyltransferase [Nocardia bhagyanarayanae]TQM31947.1 acetyltransferase (GNAT) family protein [Nocardia bhagyanarayanae]
MTPGSHVLAAAFADDPLMSLFWPDPVRRREALPRFWDSRIASRHRRGLVDLAHDEAGEIAAVALWEPAGVESPIAKPFTLVRALGRGLVKALPAVRRIDATRPAEPHLYLAAIGTRPESQGKGYATGLLEQRLGSDAERVFLVATRFSNVAFYERFGFARDEDLRLPGGPVLYPMTLSR